ncbi:hypothetical protein [Deinococcus koreensis]|uniref:hypothetical protein n=1 Tax=Deinococcus koreensis TaxID=2054903 RepID=UPI001056F4EF|nr:hypothetical protein [Deinococcus koreensis]
MLVGSIHGVQRRMLVDFQRPAYQDPKGAVMADLGLDVAAPTVAVAAKPACPERLAERATAVRQVLLLADRPLSAEQVARSFTGVRAATVDEVLEMLVIMGQARQVGEDVVAYAA